MILTKSQERTRFIRFAIVGTIGAGIDFAVFNLFTLVFHVFPVVSSVISFSTAVVSNFLLNRYWTYPDSRSKTMSQQLIQFGIISVIGLGIRTPLFAWTEPIFVRILAGISTALSFPRTFLGHNFALALAILVVMLWNFFANRYWTYSDVS